MEYIQHPRHGILPVESISEVQEKRGWKVIDINKFMKNKFVHSTIKNLKNMIRSDLIEYARSESVFVEKNVLKDDLLRDLLEHERNKLDK
jgi:hypothetical protein